MAPTTGTKATKATKAKPVRHRDVTRALVLADRIQTALAMEGLALGGVRELIGILRDLDARSGVRDPHLRPKRARKRMAKGATRR